MKDLSNWRRELTSKYNLVPNEVLEDGEVEKFGRFFRKVEKFYGVCKTYNPLSDTGAPFKKGFVC